MITGRPVRTEQRLRPFLIRDESDTSATLRARKLRYSITYRVSLQAYEDRLLGEGDTYPERTLSYPRRIYPFVDSAPLTKDYM